MVKDRDRLTGERVEISRIATATGFSEAAVSAMADAMRAGNGSMAQFSHPELGGSGQWSSGGMLMIGAMFDAGLKAKVAALAEQVSGASVAGRLPGHVPDESGLGTAGGWWPETLGRPSSSGGQNGMRYAVFPEKSRLAVESGGVISIRDTGDHRIGGVSQQQGATSTLRFTSQIGAVDLEDLTEVGSDSDTAQGNSTISVDPAAFSKERSAPSPPQRPVDRAGRPASSPSQGGSGNEIIDLIRHLAVLRDEGILGEDEFASKKADLLGRL